MKISDSDTNISQIDKVEDKEVTFTRIMRRYESKNENLNFEKLLSYCNKYSLTR